MTMGRNQFLKLQKRFERYLSIQLGSSFKIKRNPDGTAMVYDYDPIQFNKQNANNEITDDHDNDLGDVDSRYAFKTNIVLQSNLGIIVYLEIDNVKCSQSSDHCFVNSNDAANLLGAMLGAEKLTDDWGISEVGTKADPSPEDISTNLPGVVAGVAILVIMIMIVVGMVKRKRTERGIQWFPEGFALSNQLTQSLKSSQNSKTGTTTTTATSEMDRWSEEDPLERSAKKARYQYSSSDQTIITNDYDSDRDSRIWGTHHYNAANIHNPESIGALTPPQGEVLHHEMMTNDVNGRGPMGMTPLMIPSMSGNGRNDDLSGEDHGNVSTIIEDLLAQGATLKSQMDKTGETPLHLAARWQRADAAKTLLDKQQDEEIVNIQDASGRTPLHAAVAAEAQGVFQHLLKNRYTNLDAKTNDGTTPLMLAARLAIEGMVEALIEANADVNAADEKGKTALHWAAAVNNVEAVNVLLKNNANRDAQNSSDETPLFLAAREGSYQACRALLDHGANREIQDHMDRLPITVAQERPSHQDIVTLLQEHPSPAQMPGGMPHPFSSQPMMSSSGSPPNLMMMNKQQQVQQQQQQMRNVKKPMKKMSVNDADMNSMMSSNTLPRQQARRQSSVKQQQRGGNKNKNDSSSMLLSPEHSPYEPQGFMNVNPLAMSHPNLEDLINSSKHSPPSYDAAIQARTLGQTGGGAGQQPTTNYSLENPNNFNTITNNHNRQQSMPASVSSNYSNHLSPPQSNLSHVQSPPHSTGALSPTNPSVMSPPQSCGSLSPPQQQQQQQQQQLQHAQLLGSSPMKSRSIQLPTSPTHLAALRGATHQRHQGSFDYSGNDVQMYMAQQQQQQQQQQQFLYPTTPQDQQMHNNSFMSPSPDSPQWSNPSPQSHSDWSEGIHSPPMNGYQKQQQQPQQQQQQIMHRQDAVII
jgi:Notch-like protein